ncbi:MAG: hypothetical protein Q9P01_19995 [Anaerolineae bacterium]|nr:hypothetical protein [Anaerolineae bacterium]
MPLTVYPSQAQGFVSVDIPAGTSTLEIALHNTPLQSLAEWLSIAGIGLLILLMLVAWRVWQPADDNVRFYWADSHSPLQIAFWVMGIGLALFLVKTGVIDRIDSPFKTSRLVDGSITNVETTLNSDFSGEIRLLGVLLPERIKSGESSQIRVFWTLVGETLDTNYSTILYLRDSQQNIIAESGSFYPANLAPSNWLPNYYLEEVLDFEIPPFTPLGTYTLDIGLFNPETQEHLNVLNEVGNPIGVDVVLGTIDVIRPDSQSDDFGDMIGSFGNFNLLAIDGIPETAQVGDEMTIRWLWQMLETTDFDITVQAVWRNDNNQIMASTPLVPLTLGYSTSQWQAGDAWRGIHRLYVPANLESGEYTVAIKPPDEESIVVATMQVETPERNYDIPDAEYDTPQAWSNGLSLVGYDYTVTAVTVYWQTTTQIDQNLRLFVQVVDSDDSIIALTDGIPINWTRPTTSWASGEIITTQHDFGNLPSGEYRIRVGWYDPITGDRLPMSNNGDSFFLPTVFVVE